MPKCRAAAVPAHGKGRSRRKDGGQQSKGWAGGVNTRAEDEDFIRTPVGWCRAPAARLPWSSNEREKMGRRKRIKRAGDPKKGERKKRCDFIAIDHMKESLAFTAEVLISLTELHVLSVVLSVY